MVKQTNYSPEVFRKLLFDDVLSDMRHEGHFGKNDIQAVKRYFETGDLHAYLESGCKIRPQFVLFLFPNPSFDQVTIRLKTYWDWVLDDKVVRLDDQHRNCDSLDAYFTRVFSYLFDYQYGNHYSDELIAAVFRWAHGETYDPEYQFPMTFGPQNWRPDTSLDINATCTKLVTGLDSALFGDDQSQYYNDTRYTYLIDYCLSMIPLLDVDCYLTKYFARSHKENGKRTGKRAYQFRMRRFMCHMNGISPREENDDGIRLSKLEVSRPDLVDRIKQGLEGLDLPDEYHKLNKFILKHGAAAMDAGK